MSLNNAMSTSSVSVEPTHSPASPPTTEVRVQRPVLLLWVHTGHLPGYTLPAPFGTMWLTESSLMWPCPWRKRLVQRWVPGLEWATQNPSQRREQTLFNGSWALQGEGDLPVVVATFPTLWRGGQPDSSRGERSREMESEPTSALGKWRPRTPG